MRGEFKTNCFKWFSLYLVSGSVTIEFNLSYNYSKNHFLTPLNLNLMCVRVKDPDGSGEDNGYWIGHFQISEVLRKKNATTIDDPSSENSDSKKYQPILARLISPHSTSVPESFIKQRFCYVTAEMIMLSSPNRLVAPGNIVTIKFKNCNISVNACPLITKFMKSACIIIQ